MYICMTVAPALWFDVGIKRYTTYAIHKIKELSCGLMQESKDIQQVEEKSEGDRVVV